MHIWQSWGQSVSLCAAAAVAHLHQQLSAEGVVVVI